MEKEIWKDIPGYERHYQVSDKGNVRSLKTRWGEREIPKLMNTSFDTFGYKRLVLSKDNKIKSFQVHQLVAMAFLNHNPNGHNIVINHIDNNKKNNQVDNLELVSQRHNSSCHKIDVGVCWDKFNKKWRSNIFIKDKYIYLGRFQQKEDGLKMYQLALNNIHLYDGDNKTFRKKLIEIT